MAIYTRSGNTCRVKVRDAHQTPSGGRELTPGIIARFWSKVAVRSFDECWPWTAHVMQGGYGRIKINGRHESAHRLAYRLGRGPIPAGLLVRHKCDNAGCCNPFHLVVGTQQQNVADAIRRGRHVPVDWRKRRTVRNQWSKKVA